jgi:hypothetical protein
MALNGARVALAKAEAAGLFDNGLSELLVVVGAR